MSASPHTRGWTRVGKGLSMPPWGFPAHAGMDLCEGVGVVVRLGLPRTRGDGPLHVAWRRIDSGASPHTRGWTRGIATQVLREGLPRTRGDGPGTDSGHGQLARASPHTRGWTAAVPLLVLQVVGFPAHAGMDPAASASTALRRRLPRTRGDGPRSPCSCAHAHEASPHTRGWTLSNLLLAQLLQGFPAHAGMDPIVSLPFSE